MEIQRVGVAGFGTMGREIALISALAGMRVFVFEVMEAVIPDGLAKLEKLIKVVAKELSDDERESAISRITVVSEIENLSQCELVIEAIFESYEEKEKLFRRLGEVLPENAVAATNTSSLSVTRLGRAFGRQENFIGIHFFNPPTQMKLVEVVPGLLTSEETKSVALEFANKLGKRAILVKETPGFVVNRVLIAMALEAVRLAEAKVADFKEIDEAMRLGAGWPLGPFKLMDLVGLDVFLNACEAIYQELGDTRFKPPLTLKKLVEAGLLGRKTGRGFYTY